MSDKSSSKARPIGCEVPATEPSLSGEAIGHHASLLASLADETRLGIINMLASNEGPVCVCDITAQFDKGQPTISHHLAILRNAGLVTSTKIGVWSYYQLRRERLTELHQLLDAIYQPLPGRPIHLMPRPAKSTATQNTNASQ